MSSSSVPNLECQNLSPSPPMHILNQVAGPDLPTSVRLRALRDNGVVERLQSSNDVDVLVGHVLLLGRILAEVE